MRLLQSRSFAKTIKRLHADQKADLDVAARAVGTSPEIGEMKKGDLVGVRVYKFHMEGQLTLIAYEYNESDNTLTLIALGCHENFTVT